MNPADEAELHLLLNAAQTADVATHRELWVAIANLLERQL